MEKYINKIINADCIDILKQLPDNCIDLVVTNPPYNLDIKYNTHKDDLPYSEYILWSSLWIEQITRILKDGGRVAINIPLETNLNGKKFICKDYMNMMENNGLIQTAFILWDKQNVTSRTAWGSFCSPSCPNVIQPMECILVYSKASRKKEGDNTKIDITKKEFIDDVLGVWKIQPETNSSHPAPFPLELPQKIIRLFSYVGDLVLEPFSGSGTTAIACHNLKRRFICIEKDPEYWAKSCERLKAEQAQLQLF